jgi:iron complex outermembrane receptor protein
MRRFVRIVPFAVLSLALGARAQDAAPAPQEQAASPSAGGIEEITITAEKRETNLQETPVAVTAITSDAIVEQGLQDFNKIQFVAPALVYGGIADMAQISMRGVGVDISTIDAEPGVALYQDGVYRGGLTSSSALFFDMERIEVLRGPQGTLYGRNSTGGSVNVITRRPGESFAVDGEALYGSYHRWRAKAGVDVPIIPNLLSVRGAFAYEGRDGYTKNSFTGQKEDDLHARQAKLAALITPTEDIDIDLRFNWLRSIAGGPPFIKTDDHPAAPLFLSSGNPGGILNFPGVCDPVQTCVQVFGLNLSPPGVGGKDPRHVSYEGGQSYSRDTWDVNGTVTWRLGDNLTAKWVSSYLTLDQDLEPSNNDGVNIPYLVGDYVQSNREWQQELDLNGTAFDERLDWIAGFFYYKSNIAEQYLYTLPALQATFEAIFGIFGGGPPLPSGSLAFFGPDLAGNSSPIPFLNFRLEQDLRSWAAFTQGTFHLTDRLRATYGFRWTKDHKLIKQFLADNLGGNRCSPVPEVSDRTWDDWTMKGGLDFDLTEDVMVYGSISRGFKAGGANAGFCGNVYDPEYVVAYEMGEKARFLDNRVQLNLSAFYYSYKDIQVRLFTNNAALVLNAAKAKNYGVELESTFLPIDALRIDASVSFLSARYNGGAATDPLNPTDGTCVGSVCQVSIDQNYVLRAPKWKFSGAAQYDLEIGAAGTLSLRGEYAYTAKQFHTIFNNDFAVQKGYSIGNLRAIWHLPESLAPGLTFQAFVENIGNVDYVTNKAPNATTGSTLSTFGPPRTWGLQLNYAWSAE